MKRLVMAFVAAGAITPFAGALTPAAAAPATERLTSTQGFWTFDFANEKVCRAISVTAGNFPSENGPSVVEIKVVNTDHTSETIYLPAKFTNSNEAIYKALLEACDHADDNSRGDFHQKSYLISVTGTPGAGHLPATFGGVVGNLPTTGTPNAGTNGFIISVKVRAN